MTFNEDLQGVICKCGIWLAWDHIKGHQKNIHKRADKALTEVDDALAALGGIHGTPTLPIGQDFIPGLLLHRAYQCGVPGCEVIMRTASSQLFHMSKAHKNPADKKVVWLPCTAQHLNEAEAKTFFRVVMPTIPNEETLPDVVAAILKDTAKQMETSNEMFGMDNRLVSPWLLTNKWPEILGDRDPQVVRRLVDKGWEIPDLSGDLWTLVMNCSDLIPLTPQLLLERLNTKRPES